MTNEPDTGTDEQATSGTTGSRRDSLSMHADVPVWCDCCTCEAEPYWVEAFSDEDTDSDSGNA